MWVLLCNKSTPWLPSHRRNKYLCVFYIFTFFILHLPKSRIHTVSSTGNLICRIFSSIFLWFDYSSRAAGSSMFLTPASILIKQFRNKILISAVTYVDPQIFIFSPLNGLVALGLTMVFINIQCSHMGSCYLLTDLVCKVHKKLGTLKAVSKL